MKSCRKGEQKGNATASLISLSRTLHELHAVQDAQRSCDVLQILRISTRYRVETHHRGPKKSLRGTVKRRRFGQSFKQSVVVVAPGGKLLTSRDVSDVHRSRKSFPTFSTAGASSRSSRIVLHASINPRGILVSLGSGPKETAGSDLHPSKKQRLMIRSDCSPDNENSSSAAHSYRNSDPISTREGCSPISHVRREVQKREKLSPIRCKEDVLTNQTAVS